MGGSPFPRRCRFPTMSRLCWKSPISTATSRPEIVFVSRLRQSRSTDYVLHALGRSKKRGSGSLIPFGPTKTSQIALDSSTTPTALVRFDATRNGRASFLLFQGTDRSPIVLSGKSDGSLTALPGDGGLRLGNVGAGRRFRHRRTRFSWFATSSGRAPTATHRATACRRFWSLRKTSQKTAAREGSGMARRRSI